VKYLKSFITYIQWALIGPGLGTKSLVADGKLSKETTESLHRVREGYKSTTE